MNIFVNYLNYYNWRSNAVIFQKKVLFLRIFPEKLDFTYFLRM